jgi:two-component system invasion response regulator UvrY
METNNDKYKNSSKFIYLSKREFEVINMIFKGVKVSDIAKKLNLKANTISTIKKNIYYKTRVNNDIDLFKLSLEKKFINSDKTV